MIITGSFCLFLQKAYVVGAHYNNNIIIIMIKTLFHEGNTISTKLISLAALETP